MYKVVANVWRRTADGQGWTSGHQIPTFMIDKWCGDINSAAIVANGIIAPYGDMHVSLSVLDMDSNEYLSIEF